MCLDRGCVCSCEIKTKLKTGAISNLVLSNTSGLARRRAAWPLGSSQSIKWRSQGFECDQVRVVLEPLEPLEGPKRVELAATASNVPGMNELEWTVQLPEAVAESWLGQDLRVKATPIPAMQELRHQVNALCNSPEEELGWPDTAEVIAVSGATSVIVRLTAEEAPPEYEEAAVEGIAQEMAHWQGEYSDAQHPGLAIRIAPGEAPDQLQVDAQADDGEGWEATATLLTPETILIGFKPPHPARTMEGRWTGTGICWVMEGEAEVESDGSDNWVKQG